MCRPRTPEHATGQHSQPSSSSSVKSPFSVRALNASTYIIRENDSYGEHPHIYAKICTTPNGGGVIVLSDTGVGTTNNDTNLWAFLSSTINQSGLPYLVILSHCHYDHILGLNHAPARHPLTIVASSRQPSFTTPYATLQEHSLCAFYDLKAPDYTVDIWAGDGQKLSYPSLPALDLGITTLHTPGHTPDSLSFYDAHERTLYVGDSFYAQTSVDSDAAPWGREEVLPIIFPAEGDLVGWWRSLEMLIALVAKENAGVGGESNERGPVKLAAGHVTAAVDAAEFLSRVKAFFGRILRGEVACEEQPGEKRGLKMAFWSEDGSGKGDGGVAEFSLVAPLRLVEDGRENIPRDEWR